MRKVLIVGVVAAAAIIGWLYWRQQRPTALIVSGFIEADQVRVGSRVGGRVAEVQAAEGARVHAGEVLFQLDPFDLREQLRQAQAVLAARQAERRRLQNGYRPEEIEQARAKRDRFAATLEKLMAGPRPEEIEIARRELNRAQAVLDLAESEHARLDKLREEQRAAQTEYDQAVRQLKTSRAEQAAAAQRLALLEQGTRKEEIAEAKANLAETQEALKLLENGFRAEDIAKAAAEVEAAEAAVASFEVRIAELSVVSPCDCVVEAIDLHPGDLVAQNAPAVSLVDQSHLWVRSYVPELHLGRVRLNQRVRIRVDGFPDERFNGRVIFIATEGEFTPRNIQTPEERSKQVFRIKAAIEQGQERLRVGMAADVMFAEVKE